MTKTANFVSKLYVQTKTMNYCLLQNNSCYTNFAW